jgi:tetratricopeptide (TPR) repeat protein
MPIAQDSVDVVNALESITNAIYFLVIVIFLGICLIAGTTIGMLKKLLEVKGYQAIEFSTQKAEDLLIASKHEELLEYCRKYETNYPGDANVRWYQGITYYQMGDFKKSLRKLEEAIRINPNYKDPAESYIREIYNLAGKEDGSGSLQ